MGVRGLTSFLSHNPTVWAPLPKANENDKGEPTKIVIDGPALVFHIQYQNKIEWRYDGDYKRFARCVREYFAALAKSGFSAFVVINGLTKESKVEHHMSRENDTLQRVSRLIANPTDYHGQKGKEILPKFAFQTFAQVVKEQRIPHVVCDGDADRTMAWMARTRGCAVVSNDSDCYILENPNGFIQLDSLRVTPSGVTGRMFKRGAFAESLGVPEAALPLLAALVGNDQSTDAELRRLQRLIYQRHPPSAADQAQQQAHGGRSGAANYKHALIRSIGAFLAANPEDPLAEVKAMLSVPPEPKPKAMWGDDDDGADGPPGLYDAVGLEPRTEEDCAQDAERVVSILEGAAARYTVVPAGDDECDYLGAAGTQLAPARAGDWDGGKFPDSLIESFRSGDFDWKCMLILCRRTFWGHTMIENVFENPSVYLLTRPLRQIAYGILLAAADSADAAADGPATVVEYLRDGLQFTSQNVPGVYALPPSKQDGGDADADAAAAAVPLPHLSKVMSMSASERRALLLAALGVPAQGCPVAELPLPFMLPVSLVRWWVGQSREKVSVYDILAVLSCLVANEDAVAAQRMPPRFSRNAAHLCSTWSSLIEAGNFVNTALMLPVPAVSAPLACDGALVHLLHDQLRRGAARDPASVGPLLASLVTEVDPLWMLYEAAVDGLAASIDGEATRDGAAIVISKVPVIPERGTQGIGQMGRGAGRGVLGPGQGRAVLGDGPPGYGARGGPLAMGGYEDERAARKREEEELLQTVKAGYSAAIKRSNVVISKSSKMANAFAGLDGDDDDEDDDEEEEEEQEEKGEKREEEAKPAPKKADAPKERKKPEKTGDETIDNLLAEFDAMDEAKEKKKEKKKNKNKGKKGKK